MSMNPPSNSSDAQAAATTRSANAPSKAAADPFLARADECYAKGDLHGAKESLARAQECAPDDLEILDSLGSVLFQLGDYAAASRAFARACGLDSRRVATVVKLAFAELKQEHVQEFETAIAHAFELDPQNLDALQLLASLSLQAERHEDAVRFLQRILAVKPDDVNSLLSLGGCLLALGDRDTARVAFQEALKHQPNNPIAQENLAALTRNEPPTPGPRPESVRPSSAFPAVHPEDPRLDLLLKQAEAAYARGELAAALDCLRAAGAIAPRSPVVLESQGSIAFLAGDFATALDAFQRALLGRPNQPDLLVRLAMVALKLEKVGLFECALGRALDIAPAHPEGLRLLADLNLRQAQYAAAAKIYKELLDAHPQSTSLLLPLAACFYHTGDYDMAVVVYERVLELEPGNEAARMDLATVRAKRDGSKPAPPVVVAPPLVSVIVPTLNRPDMLRHALESILAQTFQDFEIIVVNDAGQDPRPVVQTFATSRSITVLNHERNRGLPAARNTGIRATRGKYIAYLDDDDVFYPNHLQTLVEALAAQGFQVAYTDSNRASEVLRDGQYVVVKRELAMSRDFARDAFLLDNLTPVLNVMHEKSCLDAVGLFDENLIALEDWELWMRMSRRFDFLHVPVVTAEVRVRPKNGSVGNEYNWNMPAARKYVYQKHQAWYTELQQRLQRAPIATGTPGQAAGGSVGPAAADAPAVSIVVLTWNQLAYTRACLESLQKFTPEPHEVILVDNGSTDETPAYLREQARVNPHYKVILNGSNRGFAAGNNQGLAIAAGRNVLLLNNDTVVTEGWLRRLLAVFERHPEVGVAGPVSNSVSGPQLVAEAAYEDMAGMGQFAARWAAQNEGQSREIQRVVGFCLLARREVIARIGGLDEQFGSGNFEDDDFCLRARAGGFAARVARDAFVHHAGSQTFKGARIDYRASLLRNWELFKRKYQLPPAAPIEQGYGLTTLPWDAARFQVPLPDLAKDHAYDPQARVWREVSVSSPLDIPLLAASPEASPASMGLPPTGEVGRLKTGYQLLGKGDFPGAWKFGLRALQLRPFHPEAFVMMGQAAQAAGHIELARQCGRRSLQLTPQYDLALEFLAALPPKGKKRKLDWPALPPDRSQTAPTLTVCVIAKNEEQFIGQCLKSIRAIAHQIVLLDTGSTDNTVQLARELGAEIHHYVWNDNFGDARNAALEHARGDWVLCLDADEEIVAAEHPKMLEVMKRAEVIGCRLPLVNCGVNEFGGSYVPRMFRNAPGLFFVGRVHEQVFPSVLVRAAEWKMKTVIGGGEIRHHGYATEVMASKNKIERNLVLLRQAVVELPDEPHLMMNLGLELSRSGQREEGLEKYAEAFRIMNRQYHTAWVPELREALLTQYSTYLMTAKRFGEAVEILQSPLAVDGGLTASMHYVLAGCHFQSGQFAQAAEHFTRCIATRNEPVNWPLIPEVQSVIPRHLLANSLVLLDRQEEAARAFREAIAENATHRQLRLDYSRFLHRQKTSVEALNLLHQLVREDATDPAPWILGCEILLSSSDYFEVALDWTAEAVLNHPANADLLACRAEILLLGQEPGEALAQWEKIAELKPAMAVGKWICQWLLHAQNPPGSPAPRLDPASGEFDMSREFLKLYRRLVSWQAVDLVNTINQSLSALGQVLPSAAQVILTVVRTADQELTPNQSAPQPAAVGT